ncbi:putative dihydroxyacetone phosphate acyltransferase [Trypanosoma conorhini]|uniref:Putative dihydroxyacetone phosphate acyltransferase n=1 Tax=Trypanosoma conorhini TaxID=83891 RepID=A0A422MW15_9TRYP|nr:putative dihydroxyacetone phosphate acyltransferase [Trypanosoma conorhini]RNE97397.1 putative dihydroxyacetone phosphate acyltransferase [Trypanosoma conorhini]
MVLALCHFLPRDVVLQFGLFLLLVSCILQAILVGNHGKESGSGTIVARDGAVGAGEIVHIGARPAMYTAAGAKICAWSNNSDLISVGCARFVEAFHVVIGLLLSSFIVSVLSLLFAMFCVVPMSRTTTSLVLLTQLSLFFPALLHTAAIGFFFQRCEHYAKDVASRSVFSDAKVKFRLGYLPKLAIASEVCLGVGFSMLFIRLLLTLFYRQSLKKRDVVRRDIGRFMRHHLVNDDWERQKAVLQSHARSVQLEMVACEVDAGAAKRNRGGVGGAANGETEEDGSEGFTFRPTPAHSVIALETGKGAGTSSVANEPSCHPPSEP